MRGTWVLLVLLGGAWLAAGPLSAQQAFYAGKTIELLVPTAVGGATDILARFFAPFLEKHIPGSPSIRIRNMPGGGTLLGMNWFA
ncbi:MAG: tricarboxylate transporter, partial [Armatimonadota bacterium]|nr:tricarboxylate transporter [Armatimonadota bacterium]